MADTMREEWDSVMKALNEFGDASEEYGLSGGNGPVNQTEAPVKLARARAKVELAILEYALYFESEMASAREVEDGS